MYKKLIFGVGIYDLCGESTSVFYRRWISMLRRAYDNKFIKKYPTYKDVTVCKEWLIFSNFKSWMIMQDWKNKALDKDILYPNNKEYSPNKCCFVETKINNLIVDNETKRGKYLQGVSKRKKAKKFQSSINIHGIATHLGYFDTETEAHTVYISNKIKYIKSFYPHINNTIQKGFDRHIDIMEKL